MLLRSLQNFLAVVIAAICVVCGNAGLTLVAFVVCGNDRFVLVVFVSCGNQMLQLLVLLLRLI